MRAQRRGERNWSRRDLGRVVVGGVIVAGIGTSGQAYSSADSLLSEFRRSLRPEQQRSLILPGDDPRRSMVQNHWAVVPATIAALTVSQQNLALGLIRQACHLGGIRPPDPGARRRLGRLEARPHRHLRVTRRASTIRVGRYRPAPHAPGERGRGDHGWSALSGTFGGRTGKHLVRLDAYGLGTGEITRRRDPATGDRASWP